MAPRDDVDENERNNDSPMADETQGIAEAAAQVNAAIPRDQRSRNAANAQTYNSDGAPLHEIFDEGAELVKIRFLEFLQYYTEPIDANLATSDPLMPFSMQVTEDDEEIQKDEPQYYYFPYLFQAAQLARYIQSYHDRSGEDSYSPSYQQSTTIFVDLAHLVNHNHELAEAIEYEHERFEPYLRRALLMFLSQTHPEVAQYFEKDGTTTSNTSQQALFFAVSFYNHPKIMAVRDMRMELIGRLGSFCGTITRTSEVRPELISATFRCEKCGLVSPPIRQEYHYTRPALCKNPRCDNSSSSWILESSTSEFVDWQKVRVQENADEIPPGSMPRSVDVIIRNDYVETAKAGDKCIFVGTLIVVPDSHALSRTGESVIAQRSSPPGVDGVGSQGVRGLKALGVRELTYRTCFVAHCVMPLQVASLLEKKQNGIKQPQFIEIMVKSMSGSMADAHSSYQDTATPEEVAMELTEEEKQDIRTMKDTPQLYKKLAQSIAPNVFGHDEVKRGILLQLLGGVHKTTAEGMKLRGDINVCIVGDPSTAKSSFLKYVHGFSPRTVYTSGKASSAAGLTASVLRDSDTGEYCIEAGALMLADQGFCCIDEFDKMDATDQVAIHEAMEQQTISITKAGIHATLNARASILAAANPIYGRYDRSKTLKANVALSAPILSRFDLFFVVLDECDETADYNVAKHILDVHCGSSEAVEPPFTKEMMQRYIRFAKTLNPVISPESERVLVESYRGLRQGDSTGRGKTAYRITVRQLESMIRLSEALARVHLDDEVRPTYVREACRLLKKSIIHVETEDITFYDEAEIDQCDEPDDENQHENVEPNRQNEPLDTIEEEPMDVEVPRQEKKPKKSKKKKSVKTQITFEEYERIANALAAHLRSNEEQEPPKYLTWSEAVDWYLEQCESEIGDSVDEMERIKALSNLVVKRLIEKDQVLIFMDEQPDGPPQSRTIAVHPNYVI